MVTAIGIQLLRSILTNILRNTIRYSPDNGVILFKVSRRKTLITFRISDQGMGVPPEDHPLIFDPFYRSKYVIPIPQQNDLYWHSKVLQAGCFSKLNSSFQQAIGISHVPETGLGLSIVKQSVELLQGPLP